EDGEREGGSQDDALEVHGDLRETGLVVDHSMRQASSNSSRGARGCTLAGSPMPRLTRKLERIFVPAKNAASTLAVSKPDIGPQSRPSARAGRIKEAPCRLPLRSAARYSPASGESENQPRASVCGTSTGSLS